MDTFYNPSISQEEENTAMIARCSYYGPTKIGPENYFYKMVVVLDSDKENEDERLINVNRPNVQREFRM